MGVYIKGMEMPKNCDECRIMVFEDTNCVPELFCGCPIVFKAHPQGVGHRPDYCPLIEVDRMNDKITLKDAIETHAWTMLYAAEPTRPVDVTMSYADLWAIFKWIKESVPESEGSDGNI